jgi:HK97 gp10 family phage protein
MIKITYDVSKLEKSLENLIKDIDEASKKSIKESCSKIKDSAKDLCPVDTGELRNSIADRYTSESLLHSGEVYTDEEHAPYVEFGTVNRAPEPFMYPAYNQNKEFIIQYLINAIEKSMR